MLRRVGLARRVAARFAGLGADAVPAVLVSGLTVPELRALHDQPDELSDEELMRFFLPGWKRGGGVPMFEEGASLASWNKVQAQTCRKFLEGAGEVPDASGSRLGSGRFQLQVQASSVVALSVVLAALVGSPDTPLGLDVTGGSGGGLSPGLADFLADPHAITKTERTVMMWKSGGPFSSSGQADHLSRQLSNDNVTVRAQENGDVEVEFAARSAAAVQSTFARLRQNMAREPQHEWRPPAAVAPRLVRTSVNCKMDLWDMALAGAGTLASMLEGSEVPAPVSVCVTEEWPADGPDHRGPTPLSPAALELQGATATLSMTAYLPQAKGASVCQRSLELFHQRLADQQLVRSRAAAAAAHAQRLDSLAAAVWGSKSGQGRIVGVPVVAVGSLAAPAQAAPRTAGAAAGGGGGGRDEEVFFPPVLDSVPPAAAPAPAAAASVSYAALAAAKPDKAAIAAAASARKAATKTGRQSKKAEGRKLSLSEAVGCGVVRLVKCQGDATFSTTTERRERDPDLTALEYHGMWGWRARVQGGNQYMTLVTYWREECHRDLDSEWDGIGFQRRPQYIGAMGMTLRTLERDSIVKKLLDSMPRPLPSKLWATVMQLDDVPGSPGQVFVRLAVDWPRDDQDCDKVLEAIAIIVGQWVEQGFVEAPPGWPCTPGAATRFAWNPSDEPVWKWGRAKGLPKGMVADGTDAVGKRVRGAAVPAGPAAGGGGGSGQTDSGPPPGQLQVQLSDAPDMPLPGPFAPVQLLSVLWDCDSCPLPASSRSKHAVAGALRAALAKMHLLDPASTRLESRCFHSSKLRKLLGPSQLASFTRNLRAQAWTICESGSRPRGVEVAMLTQLMSHVAAAKGDEAGEEAAFGRLGVVIITNEASIAGPACRLKQGGSPVLCMHSFAPASKSHTRMLSVATSGTMDWDLFSGLVCGEERLVATAREAAKPARRRPATVRVTLELTPLASLWAFLRNSRRVRNSLLELRFRAGANFLRPGVGQSAAPAAGGAGADEEDDERDDDEEADDAAGAAGDVFSLPDGAVGRVVFWGKPSAEVNGEEVLAALEAAAAELRARCDAMAVQVLPGAKLSQEQAAERLRGMRAVAEVMAVDGPDGAVRLCGPADQVQEATKLFAPPKPASTTLRLPTSCSRWLQRRRARQVAAVTAAFDCPFDGALHVRPAQLSGGKEGRVWVLTGTEAAEVSKALQQLLNLYTVDPVDLAGRRFVSCDDLPWRAPAALPGGRPEKLAPATLALPRDQLRQILAADWECPEADVHFEFDLDQSHVALVGPASACELVRQDLRQRAAALDPQAGVADSPLEVCAEVQHLLCHHSLQAALQGAFAAAGELAMVMLVNMPEPAAAAAGGAGQAATTTPRWLLRGPACVLPRAHATAVAAIDKVLASLEPRLLSCPFPGVLGQNLAAPGVLPLGTTASPVELVSAAAGAASPSPAAAPSSVLRLSAAGGVRARRGTTPLPGLAHAAAESRWTGSRALGAGVVSCGDRRAAVVLRRGDLAGDLPELSGVLAGTDWTFKLDSTMSGVQRRLGELAGRETQQALRAAVHGLVERGARPAASVPVFANGHFGPLRTVAHVSASPMGATDDTAVHPLSLAVAATLDHLSDLVDFSDRSAAPRSVALGVPLLGARPSDAKSAAASLRAIVRGVTLHCRSAATQNDVVPLVVIYTPTATAKLDTVLTSSIYLQNAGKLQAVWAAERSSASEAAAGALEPLPAAEGPAARHMALWGPADRLLELQHSLQSRVDGEWCQRRSERVPGSQRWSTLADAAAIEARATELGVSLTTVPAAAEDGSGSPGEQVVVTGAAAAVETIHNGILVVLHRVRAEHDPLTPDPSMWDATARPVEGYKCALVPLGEEEPEYVYARDRLAQELPGAHLMGVHRVQNEHRWRQYAMLYQALLDRDAGQPNAPEAEDWVWHSTGTYDPMVVADNGISTQGSDGPLGKGAYFASHASYAHQFSFRVDAKARVMFLCRVRAGQEADLGNQQQPSLTAPPAGADSVRGTIGPGVPGYMRVVYDDAHSYPQLLVSYELGE